MRFVLFPVFGRGKVEFPAEQTYEVGEIFKSVFKGDLRDAFAALQEFFGCQFESVIIQILDKRHSGLFLEHFHESAGREICEICGFFHAYGP